MAFMSGPSAISTITAPASRILRRFSSNTASVFAEWPARKRITPIRAPRSDPASSAAR